MTFEHVLFAFIYQEEWDVAAMFYESTLGLQSTFDPAKQRLKLIHCMKVLDPRTYRQ